MTTTARVERLAQSSGALLTIEAVCAQLGVNRSTLWRWIRAGVWPAPDVSMGRRFRRYRQATVDAALATMGGGPGNG